MKQTAFNRAMRKYVKALKLENTLMADAEKLVLGFSEGWHARWAKRISKPK